MKLMERGGKLFAVETSWRGHCFSDDDIELLLAHEKIEFEARTMADAPFQCTGTYQEWTVDGIHVMLFVPTSYTLAQVPVGDGVWAVPLNIGKYCDPTEQELQQLLAGNVVEVDYKTKKTARQNVSIRWYEANGSLWLKLLKHDEQQWLDSQKTREKLGRQMQERLEFIWNVRSNQWRLHFTPSLVAEFFDYDCDRFLALRALTKNPPEYAPSLRHSDRPETVGSFSSQAGNAWEQSVVQYLKRYYDVVDFSEPNSCTPDGLMDALTTPISHDRKTRFLYQAEFYVRNALPGRKKPSGDLSAVEPYWGAIKPDLLLVEEDENGDRHVSVIDVKLSRQPHMSHKMQVGLYLLLLNQCMKEYCASGEKGWQLGDDFCFETSRGFRVRLNRENGYLWNCTQPLKELVDRGEATEQLEGLKQYWNKVSYSEVMPFLHNFLGERVDTLAGEIGEIIGPTPQGAKKEDILRALPFCIGANCENCKNCAACIAWGQAADSVQLYPYLSRPAQKYLQSLTGEFGKQILTVAGLKQALKGEEGGKLRERLRGNLTWNRLIFSGNIKKMMSMLKLRGQLHDRWGPENGLGDPLDEIQRGCAQAETDEEKRKPIKQALNNRVASMQLPKTQDAAVIMTVQRGLTADGSSICYAYGIHLYVAAKAKHVFQDAQGKQIEAGGHYDFVRAAERLCAEQDCGEAFIDDLHRILSAADHYNRGQELSKKITLQGYTFDRSEFEEIQSLLYQTLGKAKDETQRQKIYDILFWLQGDRIVSDLEKHPKYVLEFPVAVLSEELRVLYEVPAYVTIQLWNAAKLLLNEDFREASWNYCMRLSDNISLSAVYGTENGTARTDKDLKGYLTSRLLLEANILLAVQRSAANVLYHKPSVFALPDASDVNDSRLSKLLFQSWNEFYLECRRFRSTIMRDPATIIAVKDCVRVSFKERDPRYPDRMICQVVQPHRAGQKEMRRAYLLPVNGNGETAQKALDTLRATPLFCVSESSMTVSNVKYRKPKTENDVLLATFTMPEHWKNFQAAIPSPGAEFILLEVPSSNQHEKERQALETIGDTPNCDALKLLYPERYYRRHSMIPGKSGEELLLAGYGKIGGTDFATGQDEAFRHVCDYNITLLQGPPGTGKTDFIGRTVAALIRANQEAGKKPLRILASAYTHAAINNALRKICEKASESGLSMWTEAEAESWMETGGKLDFDLAVYKDKNGSGNRFLIEDMDTIISAKSIYALPEDAIDVPQAEDMDIYADEEYSMEELMLYSEEYDPDFDEEYPIGSKWTWMEIFNAVRAPGAVVVGATCWACRNANPLFSVPDGKPAPEYFDLVIIDEASQMPVSLALMTMAYGRTTSTHYLIVGDNHQLPPILKGKYVPAPEQIDLHHSIFQFYLDANRHLDAASQTDGNYALALSHNFRMNEALCNYSAEKIYNIQKDIRIRYSGYSDAIKTQRLRLMPGWEDSVADPWAQQVLDPDYPLVVVYLSGATSDKVGQREMQMVSELTLLLHRYMRRKDGGSYFDPDDPTQSVCSFWGVPSKKNQSEVAARNGEDEPTETPQLVSDPAFAILSPYHKQIKALKEKIVNQYQEYDMSIDGNDLLVNTVDKLQGQEREAIIVSYGVNDVEEAVAQGEFIYNYQRLNVSLTRGKKKTILFLTSALADRPIEMLDSNNAELLKGVSFLCGLKDYMCQPQSQFERDASSFNLSDGTRVEIYRRKYTGITPGSSTV